VALVSYMATKQAIHDKNSFSFGPINEVAILFAGIFVTMIAPLAILNARSGELGLTQPWQYFWATGGLSGFLDNAPTYLTFAAVAS
jgi:Na+/H+ antiporter NhaD/arsenite permease-like protein